MVFVLVEFVFVLVQFVLIWFQDVYDEMFVLMEMLRLSQLCYGKILQSASICVESLRKC